MQLTAQQTHYTACYPDAQFNIELMSEADGDPETAVSAPKRIKKSKSSKSARAAKARKAATPTFLRHAEEQARWQTPWARTWLSLTSVSLLVVLVLQTAHHFRDFAAVQWPQTQPWLASWCAFAHCRIQAPQRIDDITVESTSLSRAAPDSENFRLSVTLRNRGALPVTTPSLELSLTDGSGHLVSRRALSAADFRPLTGIIPAGSEAALQSILSTGGTRVAGFTVEAFYP